MSLSISSLYQPVYIHLEDDKALEKKVEHDAQTLYSVWSGDDQTVHVHVYNQFTKKKSYPSSDVNHFDSSLNLFCLLL